MNRANLGHTGEAVAAKYYIRQGYLLLNHNYRTRMGELDLILYKADTIVFAEVKTRTSAQRAAPAEAVDYYKQQRLIAAAGQYLQQSPYADANIRFDVVEFCLPVPAGRSTASGMLLPANDAGPILSCFGYSKTGCATYFCCAGKTGLSVRKGLIEMKNI